MKEEINKKTLATWWLLLNSWRSPQEFNLNNRDMIKGAFEVVNSLIKFKEVKKFKIKI